MDAKHTPGPWRFDDNGDVIGPDREWIAAVQEERLPRPAEGPANGHRIAAAPSLHDVAEALLLFHGGGDWDDARCRRWHALTGATEATTRVLCDFARAALQKARGS